MNNMQQQQQQLQPNMQQQQSNSTLLNKNRPMPPGVGGPNAQLNRGGPNAPGLAQPNRQSPQVTVNNQALPPGQRANNMAANKVPGSNMPPNKMNPANATAAATNGRNQGANSPMNLGKCSLSCPLQFFGRSVQFLFGC